MWILVATYGVCTPVAVGLLARSIPVALLGSGIASLSLAATVLATPTGPDWPSQRPLPRWESLSVLWLMAVAALAGVLLLLVGMADHHGSWVIGLIGLAAAVGAGAVAIRAYLRG